MKSFCRAHETAGRHERLSSLVVLTDDLDFSAILAATQGTKPSVVQIRMNDISVQAAGPKVSGALKQTASGQGALLVIKQHRVRVRMLPIKREAEPLF